MLGQHNRLDGRNKIGSTGRHGLVLLSKQHLCTLIHLPSYSLPFLYGILIAMQSYTGSASKRFSDKHMVILEFKPQTSLQDAGTTSFPSAGRGGERRRRLARQPVQGVQERAAVDARGSIRLQARCGDVRAAAQGVLHLRSAWQCGQRHD